MRLASFNVENLFNRAKAMNLSSWREGKPVLEKFAALNQLLGEPNYTAIRKQKMVQLMLDLGLEKSDTGPFVILRRNKGKLLKRPKTGGIEILAAGRADWVGSLELIDEPVDEAAMRNTARVIIDLQPDVLAVVEVENRPVLLGFNKGIIGALNGTPFEHVMLITRCRDDIVSPFLIHRRPRYINPKYRKNKIHWTEVSCEMLTRAFKEARDTAKPYPKLSDAEQPTFHEIRALAVHLYKRDGKDAQRIAGHADEKMTKNYAKDHAEIIWTDVAPDLDISSISS